MIPFIVGVALFMQMLDSTVVATALPAMAAALDSTPVRLNVAITSYLLAAAVFVPVSGWAADRYGARRVFVFAIALFTLSSIGCALSQNLPQLVMGRIAQGVAGAMMVPVGRIILLHIVPKENLLHAMSFLAIPALVGPVIGPPIGGFMVTYMSWHWIFLINIPIGVLGIAMVLHYIEEIREDDTPRLDGLGFVLSGVCLATLVSGFESLGHGFSAWPETIALVVVGLASGWLYVLHARRAPHPIIDLSLLEIPTFAISVLGGNLCRFIVGAMPFLLAMQLQVGFGLSPFEAGMITFASAAGAMAMKFVAPRIIARFGFRHVLTVNAVTAGAFVIVCVAFTPGMPSWTMIAILLLAGFFRSLQFTCVNTLTYSDITPERMSHASSFAAMAQQLGVTLGVGVAALVMHLSMALRGSTSLAIIDVDAGYVVIGLLCVASIVSFRRLPPLAGANLNLGKRHS
jgi:EmrB/QacA subfamily drug resistance transporter